ncbi:unnamed protein product [Schistosoma margrebowiei]|uniref:Uncharacterized protein n=1 Tax=Schistosoma margrebowiei TaxID=48269 RepID=A0A183NBR1_9TREM|nr:unnamed protein product [Schistosoma margrebowiei]
MEDVRTRRGADMASDHHLVESNLKLLNEFKIALNNRFQALQDQLKEDETTMEDNWKGIKEALTSTCQEVLVVKKHHHKWFKWSWTE